MVLYPNIFCLQTTRQVTDHAVALRSSHSLGLDSGSLVPIAFIGCSVESGSIMKAGGVFACKQGYF